MRYIVGVGAWNTAGRVSTLEMVGLNPQPEPPSRTAIAIYTSGATAVRISVTCTRKPEPNRYVATGKGSNGLWYLITIVNATSSTRGGDRVGVTPVAVPPNPCTETSTGTLTAGEFFLR